MARRLPGLRIRPGSVRLARQEAGLSLGGVARQDLSRTAIFLIEKGKTNPTLPTLELISERTGKPISFFLDDEAAPAPARIDYAEIEHQLATEQLARVLELTEPLLAERQPRADLARLRFLRGQAHIRMADADSAEPLLQAARQHYEVSGDELMAVECLSWEVHIPYLREDPAALALAEAALARCRHLPAAPIQTEVRIVARIAGIHAARREWPKAVTCFEEAIELLGPVKDLHRMAAVYTDLGGVYRAMGKLEVAARYLQRAIALHEIVDDQRSLAMAENNLGLALMNMSNYASAQTHLDRAMEIFEQVGIQRGRSHVLLSLSELHLQRGALDTSERFGKEALELSSRLGEKATQAEAHQWLGRGAAARGDAEGADREFDAAISLLQQAGLTERLIHAHSAYAEILEDRGDLNGAHRHLKELLAASRPDLVRRSAETERARRPA